MRKNEVKLRYFGRGGMIAETRALQFGHGLDRALIDRAFLDCVCPMIPSRWLRAVTILCLTVHAAAVRADGNTSSSGAPTSTFHDGFRNGQMGGFGPASQPNAGGAPGLGAPVAPTLTAPTPTTPTPAALAPQAPLQQASVPSVAASKPSVADRTQDQCAQMLEIWREKKKNPRLNESEKADLRRFDQVYRARCI